MSTVLLHPDSTVSESRAASSAASCAISASRKAIVEALTVACSETASTSNAYQTSIGNVAMFSQYA